LSFFLSANEHASASNRKTINPQDVFMALEDLEFPDFRNRLEAELASMSGIILRHLRNWKGG